MATTFQQTRAAVAVNENGVTLNAEGATGSRTNGARSVTVAITNTGAQTITAVAFYFYPTKSNVPVPNAAFATNIGTITAGATKYGQVTDVDFERFYVTATTGAGLTTAVTFQAVGTR